MSLRPFEVEKGISINGVLVLLTTAAPDSNSSQDFLDAAVGSVAINTISGGVYKKINANQTWERLADQADITGLQNSINALVTGISWREPAIVADFTSTTLPVGTAGQPIVIDGVSIANNQRVLFANVTASKNIYIYNQTAGTWTEDTNTLTTGDTLYVDSGTSGGFSYTYNSNAWVKSGQSNIDEEGFIRSFIGKLAAGSELPVYISHNVLVDHDTLTSAASKLDAEEGYINAVLGKTVGNNPLTYTSTTNITQNAAVNLALSEIDAALDLSRHITSTNGVTTATVIDSMLVRNYRTVKWIVSVTDAVDPTITQSVEVFATHDGTPTTDATLADHTVYSKIKFNQTKVLGYTVTYDTTLTGTGASQTLNLTVTASQSANIKATREVL